jgi:hypothetical protein
VPEVPVAVRFWNRVDAMTTHSLELLRTCRKMLESKFSGRTRLRFTSAAMSARVDAVLSRSEVAARRISQLLGNLTPRKKMVAFVIAGVVGLALLLLLLEISVRSDLAKEARNAAMNATTVSSASAQDVQFEELFPAEATSSTSLQSLDQLGASEATPSSDYGQTFGQVFREPIHLPRSRKLR